MKWLFLAIVSSLFFVGCAQVFSERSESLVDPAITFKQLRKDPQAFVGKFIKVGGIIANTKFTRTGSQIEVVQLSLNYEDIPYEEDGSAGRFLATSTSFLDSMIFKPGRSVAIIGEIRGEQKMPLGESEYIYPVIAIKEIHIWKNTDIYPYPAAYDPYPYGWVGPPHRYPPFGPRYNFW